MSKFIYNVFMNMLFLKTAFKTVKQANSASFRMQQKCEGVIPDLTDENFGKLLTGNECTKTTTTA